MLYNRWLCPFYQTKNKNFLLKGDHHENSKGNWEFSWLSKNEFKKNTLKNYRYFLAVFKKEFGNFDISKITSEEIMDFLINVSEGQKQTTKKLKYSLLKALFNFIKNSVDLSLINPCDSPILRKTFKVAKGQPWTILDRDVVDEIIFKTDNFRNRLMLELMAIGSFLWDTPEPLRSLKKLEK